MNELELIEKEKQLLSLIKDLAICVQRLLPHAMIFINKNHADYKFVAEVSERLNNFVSQNKM